MVKQSAHMHPVLLLFLSTGLKEKRRHIVRQFVHSLLPVLLTIFVIYGQQRKVTLKPGESYENDPLKQDDLADYFPGELVNKIYYSPQTKLTEELMENVRQRLYIVDERVVPFISDAEMEFALLDNPYICFGVFFQHVQDDGGLRFVIRTKNNNFRTDVVYSQDVFSSYQKRDNEYIESGFLALQNAIDQSFVAMLATQRTPNDVPRLDVAYGHIPVDDNRGPKEPVASIHLMTVLAVAFVIMAIFALLLPMVEERANGMREHLKIACSQSYWKELALYILNVAQFGIMLLICLTIALASGFWEATVALVVYFLMLGMLFVTNLITFTFFLSTTVESPTVATAAAPILFFAPYFLSMLSTEFALPFCVFPVVGLCYAGLTLDVFKSSGHLFHAHNLFTVGYPGLTYISLFHIFVCQLVGTALWLFLWFYVSNVFPGRYGSPKSKLFFLAKSYWMRLNDGTLCGARNINKICTESQHNLQQHSSASNRQENYFETISMVFIDSDMPEEVEKPDAESEKVVSISNLCKIFGGRSGGDKEVVKNFSLSIYSNSLTVLLGHNGAGKTTTMNIITGILPRTSGTIIVDGEENPDRYRQRIGFCPQHNVFFSFLNCREHLEVFGRLRGLTAEAAKAEAQTVLQKVNLREKSESFVHTLSGGMKRRLSLGNAIIGNTKLLILDEPTSGLDPESRRDIWDVLLKLRQNHTILLTTHFMEEADVLADWVAIMDNGELVACGSPLELKKDYGKGYTLKLFKKLSNGPYGEEIREFDQSKTWQLIQQHVPNAAVRDSVKEIFAVTLPYEDEAKYSALLKELEEAKCDLGIESLSIANTTLEEVFLKIRTIQHHPESIDCVDSPPEPLISNEALEATRPTTTFLHARRAFSAIWRKKWIHMKSNKHIYGFLLTLPMVVTVLCFIFTTGTIDATNALPAVMLEASAIHQAIGVIAINRAPDSDGNEAFGQLEAIRTNLARSPINGVRMVMMENVSLVDSLHERMAEDYTAYRDRVVVGIELNISSNAVDATVLHNNNLVHSTGIAESTFATLLLRFYVGLPDATVHAENIPSTRKQLIDIATPFFFTELIAIAFMFYMLIYLSMPLNEHLTGFRQLQNINRYVYWTWTYLYDFLVHMVVCALVTGLVYAMDRTEAFSEASKHDIFVILLLYGMRALLVIYIISQCVENANTAITIMSYLMIAGVAGVLMLANGYDDMKNNSSWILLLHLVPEFALKVGMRVVYENQKLIIYEQLSMQQNRDHSHSTTFANKRIDTLVPELIAPVLCLLLALFLNEVVENIYRREKIKNTGESAGHNIRKVYRQVSRTKEYKDNRLADVTDSSAPTANDVKQETELVDLLVEQKKDIKPPARTETEVHPEPSTSAGNKKDAEPYAIIVKSVKKMYANHEAVKSVSFAVKKGECFGLLGMNGAGKTTVFQMLSRNLPVSEGKIYLEDCEVHEVDARKYRNQYGYCPQFDVLLDFMTVYQVIDYFAQLKGVSERETHINNWLAKLDILQYKNHTLDECSGGTKRKVNTILALLGGPSVVLLDEPTTGVDPKSRQYLWKTIKAVQRKHQTVLLTSHSMDECEELCNRLSIMADGLLKCVGTVPELKQRHGKGYNLWIKLKMTVSASASGSAAVVDFELFIKEVKECFEAELQEKHKGLLKFVVSPSLELSKLFHYAIELKAKHTEKILTISIYECTLEDIFLGFRPAKKHDS